MLTKRKRGDIINLAADETATKHHGDNNSKNFLKKFKKVVDKHKKMCYSKQAVAETAKNKTLNLDNKTVYSNPENSLMNFWNKT